MSELTIEQAVAVLNGRKWRGHTDWHPAKDVFGHKGVGVTNPHSEILTDHLRPENAIAIAQGLIDRARVEAFERDLRQVSEMCDAEIKLRTDLDARIFQLEAENAALREQLRDSNAALRKLSQGLGNPCIEAESLEIGLVEEALGRIDGFRADAKDAETELETLRAACQPFVEVGRQIPLDANCIEMSSAHVYISDGAESADASPPNPSQWRSLVAAFDGEVKE